MDGRLDRFLLRKTFGSGHCSAEVARCTRTESMGGREWGVGVLGRAADTKTDYFAVPFNRRDGHDDFRLLKEEMAWAWRTLSRAQENTL